MSKKFKRQEGWKYKKLDDKWRKGRGAKSPLKRGKAGRAAQPTVGFRSPRKTRGLHPTGLVDVLVYNVSDLSKLDPKTDLARIGGSVGARKKQEIVKKAKELNLKVVQDGFESSKKNSE